MGGGGSGGMGVMRAAPLGTGLLGLRQFLQLVFLTSFVLAILSGAGTESPSLLISLQARRFSTDNPTGPGQ